MNYFFVSQRDQAKENEMKKLTAPDDKSHSYVAKYIHVDDLIVQYNSVSLNITGVARAIKKPYVVNGTIYADIDIYNFESPLPKDVWVKKLREKQGEEKTPVNENYSVNSRYLQKMNEASFNYILEEAQKFEKNKDIVDTIRKLASSDFTEPPSEKKQTVRSNQDSTMIQKIFFGAPGTGKSFAIDDPNGEYKLKTIEGERVFRTTFHPDYDYAQFVGAYKPVNAAKAQTLLNKDDLLLKLNNLQASGETYPVQKFGTLYYESIDKLSSQDKIELIRDAGFDDSIRTAELPKGTAIGKFLDRAQKSSSITYSFVPQVFAKAYAAAWKLYLEGGSRDSKDIRVFLVIEEINRGNCAQIFGDIFQLLDRDSEGFSQYSIDADSDFAEWLEKYGLESVWDKYLVDPHVKGGKIALPPNLNILATMNTSDQSLFPMDSAFKRRFDWEYVPISFTDEEGNEKEAATYEIEIFDENGAPCKREGGKPYLWKDFVDTVNDKILTLTESEDKQLGEFFIKPDSGKVISNKRFLGKVMFYLWNEVCKDEHKDRSFFKLKDGSYFTFQDLYRKKDLLKRFMDELLKEEG